MFCKCVQLSEKKEKRKGKKLYIDIYRNIEFGQNKVNFLKDRISKKKRKIFFMLKYGEYYGRNWNFYSFVLVISIELICFIIIGVFCVLFKKDQSKENLNEEKIERWNVKL